MPPCLVQNNIKSSLIVITMTMSVDMLFSNKNNSPEK